MAMKSRKTKASTNRLTEELLETARDMQLSGLLTKAAHSKITMRHARSAPVVVSRSQAMKSSRFVRSATLVRRFLQNT